MARGTTGPLEISQMNLLASLFFLQGAFGHLLVLKSYDPPNLTLDAPCAVRYQFINPSNQTVRVDSFFDYTFFQSFFSGERSSLPQLQEGSHLLVGPGSKEELRFDLLPKKAGTFQDLPAKTVYSFVITDESGKSEPRTTWSAVHGKMNIAEATPLNSFGQKEMERLSQGSRWAVFLGVAAFNVVFPSVKWLSLKRRLRSR